MKLLIEKLERLEQRLIDAERLTRSNAYQLDNLIKEHNELFDAHVKLLKSYNESCAWMGQHLGDTDARVAMLIDRVAPEQPKFESEINRIFTGKKKDKR